MSRKILDPIPPEPFQRWIFERLQWHKERILAEAGAFAVPTQTNEIQRVCEEIGWEWNDTAARRLYRWRHGMSDTKVGGRHGKTMAVPRKLGLERAQVEDACHHAGVDFYELYPQFAHEREGSPEPEAWCPNCQSHVMTVHNKVDEPVCIWCDWKISDGHMNRGLVTA